MNPTTSKQDLNCSRTVPAALLCIKGLVIQQEAPAIIPAAGRPVTARSPAAATPPPSASRLDQEEEPDCPRLAVANTYRTGTKTIPRNDRGRVMSFSGPNTSFKCLDYDYGREVRILSEI